MRESDPRRSLHGTEALKAHTWFQQPSQLPYCLARTAWSFELISGSQLRCLWPAGRSCIFAPEIICSPVPPPASRRLADPRSGAAARRRFAGPAPRRILCQPRHSGPARRSLNGAPSGDLRMVSVFQEPDVARSYGPVPWGWPIPFVPILSPSIRCLPRFYFCFVTSWLYLWKSRSSEVVSGKPIARKISTTKEGYRAADTADAWNRTVGFLAEDAQKLTGGLRMAGPMVCDHRPLFIRCISNHDRMSFEYLFSCGTHVQADGTNFLLARRY